MPFATQSRFYGDVMRRVLILRVVPEAAELAKWIKTQTWEHVPSDFDTLVSRLEQWPAGHPYPPFPDDAALVHGIHPANPKWWTPGAKPNVTAIRKALNQLDEPTE